MQVKKEFSETQFSQFILIMLNNIPQCRAIKRLASISHPGEPDITGSINGYRFEIECKLGYNRLTPMQELAIKRWKEVGVIAGMVKSISDVLMLIWPQTGRDQKISVKAFLTKKRVKALYMKHQIEDALSKLDYLQPR